MIFLSYAKEDKALVDDVYRYLRAEGLTPWMDKPPTPFEGEGIKPGSDWDAAIRRALDDAEVVLAFLSKRSITKRGYVQREYKLALKKMAELPVGERFLIPVLLEPCEPPNVRVDTIELRSLQWFDLYANGIEHLVASIRAGLSATEGGETLKPIEEFIHWNQNVTWDPELASVSGLVIVYLAWLASEKDITIDLKKACEQLQSVDYLYAYGFLVALRAVNVVLFRSDFETAWHFYYVNPWLLKNFKGDIRGRIKQMLQHEGEDESFATLFEADVRRIEDYIVSEIENQAS